MVLVEMRKSMFDKAFEQLDEVKHYGKKQKLALCELEETLYDCYESEGEEGEYEDYSNEELENPSENGYENEYEIDYRRSSNMGRRSGLRMRHHDDDDDMNMRKMRVRSRRLRNRNRY